MSSVNVLFDAPGPRTVARHRIYTVVGGLAVLAVLGWVIWKLYDDGQFEGDKWEVFVTPDYVQRDLPGTARHRARWPSSPSSAPSCSASSLGVGKLSSHRWVRWPSWAFVEFFRAIPVLLLMVFIWYGLGIQNDSSSFWGVVIALTLYNGSVLAEVLRAGVNAVPRGQAEAAYAIGLRKTQVMNLVLMPQAVKIMLPAIISQCVVALKDTALGVYILVAGTHQVYKQIYLEFDNRIPTMLVIAGLYIGLNLILTMLATWVQKKFVGEKKPLEISMVGVTDADTASDPRTRPVSERVSASSRSPRA